MSVCPITYEDVEVGTRYSTAGLRKLSPRLTEMHNLPFTAEELVREAAARAARMSIQGAQPKVSAVLNVGAGEFQLVDTGGRYILKPQNPSYESLPENEDLIMRLAETVGIKVPQHGLLYAEDGSLVYFTKRFDRNGRDRRIAVEDFAQLAGLSRDTKYEFSMERVAGVVSQFCTFPIPQKEELFRRTLFNFVVGNEDMHAKNFSLVTLNDVVSLSPAYDLLSSCIVIANPEEIALPIAGRKRNLTENNILDYFGIERLGLPRPTVDRIVASMKAVRPEWEMLVGRSFLPQRLKDKLLLLIDERFARLS